MDYQTGEKPQVNDEVLGEIDGKPARGRVLAVRESGRVLVSRRAAYQGHTAPLVAERHEVDPGSLKLVYRPRRPGQPLAPAVAAPAPQPARRKAAAGGAKK